MRETHVRLPDIRTGSHNVVVGQAAQILPLRGARGRRANEISGDSPRSAGGVQHRQRRDLLGQRGAATRPAATSLPSAAGQFVGGDGNTASGDGAVVSGGRNNIASGGYASVSGGQSNTASGDPPVSGGQATRPAALSPRSAAGRSTRPAGDSAPWSAVAAIGQRELGNTASGESSSVSGGQNITQETEFGWSAGSEADEVVEGNFRSP